jgi:hypothetical protein
MTTLQIHRTLNLSEDWDVTKWLLERVYALVSKKPGTFYALIYLSPILTE